jgi:hypothetical protein
MTVTEQTLRTFLLRYPKTESLPQAISDAAKHVGLTYDETRQMIKSIEDREEIFFETDPARDRSQDPPRKIVTRCWWEDKPRNRPARYEP